MHGDSCSQLSSNERACATADDGYYLFVDVAAECAAVPNAVSVTCEDADNSRAECLSLKYHHTDNSQSGESDTCTECVEQPQGCASSPDICMSGCASTTDTPEGVDCVGADASSCEVLGCAYSPPEYLRCDTAEPGFYIDSNEQAHGACPAAHRVLLVATVFQSYACAPRGVQRARR